MTKQGIAVREKDEAPMVPAAGDALTPMAMLDRALSGGATPETLEKLMALQERWEASQAKKAYDDAMAMAKAEFPVIVKDKQVTYSGSAGFKHETLPGIAKLIDPILTKHGLGYRFQTASDKETVTVTCVVSHKLGHSEENSLTGPHDKSGGKNVIQAVGSSVTYLQRYTLKAALGLAAADDDDAKAASGAEPVTEAQATELRRLIDLYGAEEPKIKAHAAKLAGVEIAEIEDMPARVYDRVVTALTDWARKQRGAG